MVCYEDGTSFVMVPMSVLATHDPLQNENDFAMFQQPYASSLPPPGQCVEMEGKHMCVCMCVCVCVRACTCVNMLVFD